MMWAEKGRGGGEREGRRKEGDRRNVGNRDMEIQWVRIQPSLLCAGAIRAAGLLDDNHRGRTPLSSVAVS